MLEEVKQMNKDLSDKLEEFDNTDDSLKDLETKIGK
jgi:hypothetical protein